jgi:hypothetical protein
MMQAEEEGREEVKVAKRRKKKEREEEEEEEWAEGEARAERWCCWPTDWQFTPIQMKTAASLPA